MLFNSGTNTCTNLNVELAKTKHILYQKKKHKRRRHCVQNMMSVSIIWDFYEFIVFTEEILHLLLQELLNFPHTRSELKLWWISSHGSRSRCYIFFYGICSVVFFISTKKDIKMRENLLKNNLKKLYYWLGTCYI